MLLRDDLHAKVYSSGLASAWAGSANTTASGLGLARNHNLELLAHLDPMPRRLRCWMHWLLATSNKVDTEIHAGFADWLKRQEAVPAPQCAPKVESLVEDTFSLAQLPALSSPSRMWELISGPWIDVAPEEIAAFEHDLGIFGISECASKESLFDYLAPRLLEQPLIEALVKSLPANGMHFGGLKEWLQRNCSDVPVPYRRDLTRLAQASICWLVELEPGQFEVVRPRYSQVLRRRSAAL